MLTIVASMERELSALNRSLAPGPGPELRAIGIGPDPAAKAVTALLSRPSLSGAKTRRAVLLLGFAGAVSPDLRTGDLILSTAYHRQAAEGTISPLVPDPEMTRLADRAAAIAGLAASHGHSLTVEKLVSTPAEKRILQQAFGVTSVNMEDHAVAAAAAQAGAAFLSARVVLDTSEQKLPGYLTELSDSSLRAVLATAARPWRIPGLLALAGKVRRTQYILRRFGLAFIQVFQEFDAAGNRGAPESSLSADHQNAVSPQRSQGSAKESSGAVTA